jgi:hypothetical protein
MPFTLTITHPNTARIRAIAHHPTADPDEDEYGKVETPGHPTPETPDAPGRDESRSDEQV